MGSAKDRHQAPTNQLKIIVSAIVESESDPPYRKVSMKNNGSNLILESNYIYHHCCSGDDEMSLKVI